MLRDDLQSPLLQMEQKKLYLEKGTLKTPVGKIEKRQNFLSATRLDFIKNGHENQLYAWPLFLIH